jgi:hypothetical protein
VPTLTCTLVAATTAGQTSPAIDISGVTVDTPTPATADWTTTFSVTSLTPEARALLALEDSTDGFVTYRAIGLYNPQQGGMENSVLESPALRRYMRPSARFGILNAQLRIRLLAIGNASNPTVTATVKVEY